MDSKFEPRRYHPPSSRGIYTVSQENVPLLTCYNLDIHGLITIIFGTSVTEKVGNQNAPYFRTSPNLCLCTTWGKRKPENCVFSLKCCTLFTKNTNTLKHHLVTAEPPFTVKTIDGMHQTRQDLGSCCLLPSHCYPSLSRCRSLCKRWDLFSVKPE